MLLTLLTLVGISTLSQAGGLPGQTTLDGGAWTENGNPPTNSGWPINDPFQRHEETLTRPLRHVVRQLQDMPVPGSPLPLPAPAEFQRFQETRRKPLTIDYVFMPQSSVSGAQQGVTYNEIGADYVWARPFWASSVFLFRPAVDIVFLAGPAPQPEVPEQLYKVAFDLQLDVPINETVGVSIGLTPGLWTDFIVVDGDDFRLPARALMTFRVNESLFLAAGVLYTDNIRRNVLPDIGVVWDPTSQWHLELLYPRSRVLYRFSEDWGVYFVFERGGTTYNIRTQGQDEDMEYRDWRAMFGVEVNRWSAFDLFVEVGGAWDRMFRFDIQPDADIGDAFLLRAGARF